MLTKLLTLVGRLASVLLAAVAVCTPFGNTLVCLLVVFFGPAAVIGLLAQ